MDDVESLIAGLIQQGFLNEERFAKLFARSKMRQKQWGVQKIKQALKQKQVSDYCIRIALKELEQEEYAGILQKTAERKWLSLQHETPYIQRNKLAQYLLRKGFEADAVWRAVATLVRD
jgi:regulatory protein